MKATAGELQATITEERAQEIRESFEMEVY